MLTNFLLWDEYGTLFMEYSRSTPSYVVFGHCKVEKTFREHLQYTNLKSGDDLETMVYLRPETLLRTRRISSTSPPEITRPQRQRCPFWKELAGKNSRQILHVDLIFLSPTVDESLEEILRHIAEG